MEISKVICVLAILFILVVAFYQCPKAGFKIPQQGPVLAANNLLPRSVNDAPLGNLADGSLSALGSHHFRGGDQWANMIGTGKAAPLKQDAKIPELMSAQDTLPDGMIAGMRDDPPYEMKVASVQLRSRYATFGLDDLLNSVGRPIIHPVHSVHQMIDVNPAREAGPQLLLPGDQPKDPNAWNPAMAVMELERV